MVNDRSIPTTITLDHSHPAVRHLCTKDKRIAKLIDMVGAITYEPHSDDDIYPFLIHEIIEQMLSIKAGIKIYGRLEDLCTGKSELSLLCLIRARRKHRPCKILVIIRRPAICPGHIIEEAARDLAQPQILRNTRRASLIMLRRMNRALIIITGTELNITQNNSSANLAIYNL